MNCKLWTDVYPLRIAPFLMILYSFWSSRRDLSFETHFDFFGFFCSSVRPSGANFFLTGGRKNWKANHLRTAARQKKVGSGRPDGRKKKKTKKPKCVSNDRSRRDDSNAYWIVKIGAILGYFWPLQSFDGLTVWTTYFSKRVRFDGLKSK